MIAAIASRGGHRLLKAFMHSGLQRFERQAHDLEAVQRRLLRDWSQRFVRSPRGRNSGIHPADSWEQVTARLPSSHYSDYQDDLERQRRENSQRLIDSPVSRYQPTSGSTSAIKWIPYTRTFLAELDRAISPWIGDLYRQYPQIAQGSHYWSLSWIPSALRDSSSADLNDDMQ